jgi:hypothetical protein
MTRGLLGRYSLPGPCSDCPFRRELPIPLRAERAEEIAASLADDWGSFTCHKTNEFGDDEVRVTESSRECGGAVATLLREGRPSVGYRLAAAFGWTVMSPEQAAAAPVFDTLREWVAAMRELRE